MPTTGIKLVVNAWTSTIEVKDHEDPAKPGHLVQVSVNSGKGCDMWVPWCNNASDFLGAHYITVKPAGQPVKYWIYQSGEQVVCVDVEKYVSTPDRRVLAMGTGGNHALFIMTSGAPSLARIGIY
jgi:hypothetical protein